MMNTTSTPMRKLKSRQLGIAMIEVLVSVTILSLGLVGLAALQARSLMMNQSSHYRSIAADLATDLADRIHANRSPFLGSTDADPKPGLPPNFAKCAQGTTDKDTATCAAQDAGRETYLVSTEMTEWNTALRSQLPGASWTLDKTDAGDLFRYTLTISWLDNRTTAEDTSYSVVIE